MKAIEKLREWYQSKKGHCDALIEDVVLLDKIDGESKEDRSQQEEDFIDCLQRLRGCLISVKEAESLHSKIECLLKVDEIIDHWGMGDSLVIQDILANIQKTLSEKVENTTEQEIKRALKLFKGLYKNRPGYLYRKDNWLGSYFCGIERMLKTFLSETVRKRRKPEPYFGIDSLKEFFESKNFLMMVVNKFGNQCSNRLRSEIAKDQETQGILSWCNLLQ